MNISILGSTGSIGTQTLDIVRINHDMNVVALAANKSIDLLYKQILEFSPELVCVYDEEAAGKLEAMLADAHGREELHTLPELVTGMEGLIETASISDADIVVTAVVGMMGIEPTIAAIKAHKNVALANKETLVCAGHIIMPLAKNEGVKILPVDSEHSAIFQCLQGRADNRIRKILLTASGGPFLHKSLDELKSVKVEDALKHPNWNMGAKVTIDSSTMVNKGLEVCEASWLFDTKPSDIEVVIQPQSIVHSAVEFEDGAVIAELGVPDMHLPISYALTYPERRFVSNDYLDLFKIGNLEFIKPDLKKFKGLVLAFGALKMGGSAPTVFNIADEEAVKLFLARKIGYTDIPDIIGKALDGHKVSPNPDVDEILGLKKEITEQIESWYK